MRDVRILFYERDDCSILKREKRENFVYIYVTRFTTIDNNDRDEISICFTIVSILDCDEMYFILI